MSAVRPGVRRFATRKLNHCSFVLENGLKMKKPWRTGSASAGPVPFWEVFYGSPNSVSRKRFMLPDGTRMPLRLAAALLAMCITAAPADSSANQIDAAIFTAQCTTFKILVAGRGVNQPNPIVGYNITLTPPSGESLIITDSFPVMPDSSGSFRKTFANSWKTFGFTLTGKYTLSGSAVLVSGLKPLSTIPIAFSSTSLTCKE